MIIENSEFIEDSIKSAHIHQSQTFQIFSEFKKFLNDIDYIDSCFKIPEVVEKLHKVLVSCSKNQLDNFFELKSNFSDIVLVILLKPEILYFFFNKNQNTYESDNVKPKVVFLPQ
jgi:hypothetical protein